MRWLTITAVLLLGGCVSTPGHTAFFGAGSALYDTPVPPIYEPDFAPAQASQALGGDDVQMPQPSLTPDLSRAADEVWHSVTLPQPEGPSDCHGIPLPDTNYCIVPGQ